MLILDVKDQQWILKTNGIVNECCVSQMATVVFMLLMLAINDYII